MLHPDPVQVKHVSKLMNSGALFARKFVLGTSDEAWSNIEKILSQKVGGKADRLRLRLSPMKTSTICA